MLLDKLELNILVVDDNPGDLDFYVELLEDSSRNRYKIYTADNGKEAIQIFKEKDIDCSIIDYFLPEMNGLKIIDELYKLKPGSVLPIIMLTGQASQKIQAEAARKGVSDYINKDTANSSEQLDNIIDKALNWFKAVQVAY